MSAVFPTAYFGSIAYYKRAVSQGEIQWEMHEHYVKQSLRNRMQIVSANGILPLSIPVIKPYGSKTCTKDIRIDHSNPWAKIHFKAIESGYASSPYFDHYASEIQALLFNKTDILVDFNRAIHNQLVSWLELPITLSETTEYKGIKIEYQGVERDSSNLEKQAYTQVFQHAQPFHAEVSILDAILCLGPMARRLIV